MFPFLSVGSPDADTSHVLSTVPSMSTLCSALATLLLLNLKIHHQKNGIYTFWLRHTTAGPTATPNVQVEEDLLTL